MNIGVLSILHILLILIKLGAGASRVKSHNVVDYESASSSTTLLMSNSSSTHTEISDQHAFRHDLGAEDIFSTKAPVRFNQPDLVLSPNHIITDRPRTLNYTFVKPNGRPRWIFEVHMIIINLQQLILLECEWLTMAPFLFVFVSYIRSMLVINGQYPGPLIEVCPHNLSCLLPRKDLPSSLLPHLHPYETTGGVVFIRIQANEGDTLNVLVVNRMTYPVSIHWHGKYLLYLYPKYEPLRVDWNGYFGRHSSEGQSLGVLSHCIDGKRNYNNKNLLTILRKLTPLLERWMAFQIPNNLSGVTECPIQPGVSFLYSFTIRGQFGTFCNQTAIGPGMETNSSQLCLHLKKKAHTRNLKADGIVGPLIVHSTRDPLIATTLFYHDSHLPAFHRLKLIKNSSFPHVLFFHSDWYHEPRLGFISTSTYILGEQLSTRGYNGSFAAPSPNSALLNGVGYFDCARYAGRNGRRCSTRTTPLELRVRPNAKTRLRLIQASSHALFRVSVDNHLLDIIEADATPVQNRQHRERVQIHGGERYSVVLNTANDREGDSFYLRAAIDTDCRKSFAPGMDTPSGNTARAVIRVTKSEKSETSGGSRGAMPRDSDWPTSSVGTCYDVDSALLTPRMRPPPLTAVVGRVFFSVSFGTIVVADQPPTSTRRVLGRFFVDNTTYTGERTHHLHHLNRSTSSSCVTRFQRPLLHHMLKGGQGWLNASDVAYETLPTPGVWDIVINNLDVAREHPFHLRESGLALLALWHEVKESWTSLRRGRSNTTRRPRCAETCKLSVGMDDKQESDPSQPMIPLFILVTRTDMCYQETRTMFLTGMNNVHTDYDGSESVRDQPRGVVLPLPSWLASGRRFRWRRRLTARSARSDYIASCESSALSKPE
ncbi:hypothetical protein VP01_970g2 [Puccinia sorghi]|uniref:Plastocyanin-like domain-containing protein n=1 Tax=Puccinia sorghi TaxID=27349 RepID=A0A0L6U5Y0_9BASI|nr:hypothetical protein VP01_970g2 [Puccinia sorghi]